MVGGGGEGGDGKLCPPKAKCAATVQVGAGGGGRVWDEERLANRMGC